MRNKKLILVLTILTMVISMSACGQDKPTSVPIEHSTESNDNVTSSEDITEIPEDTLPPQEATLYERVGGKLYVGDEFTLGTYEQDNNLDNGAEDIEWIVLEKTGDNEYLCISKYVLDAQFFGKDNLEIRNRWSTSYLREWLNNSFYNTAFSDTDTKNLVKMSTKYYTWQSINDTGMYSDKTEDMVRVLNYGELDEVPVCVKVTDYAKAQGAPYIDDGTREHENCSNGWYMMSYNVDNVIKVIRNHMVTGSRGATLSVAIYDHDEINKSKSYMENEARHPQYLEDYLEGVRPVISVKLSEN